MVMKKKKETRAENAQMKLTYTIIHLYNLRPYR